MQIGATLDDLLVTAALPERARIDVLRRMGAPCRHYHGLRHLAYLWMRHRRYGSGTPFVGCHLSRLIACAIAFHDAIYDPTRSDNERRSAQLWRRSAPADLSARDVAWVAEAILATANHLAPRPDDTLRQRALLWMLDLDLTPLGEEPGLFARNTRALRIEYRHIPEADWQRRRTSFLRGLLAAPALYRSTPIAAAFAAQARRNIAGGIGDC